MKIQIKNSDIEITIPVPTGLIFSDFSAWVCGTVGMHYAGDAMKDIPPEALRVLFREFRRIKRTRGEWTLVEVQGAAGEHIVIRL